MTSPDLMNADPEYGTPKVAGKSIEISVTPNYKENKVYASNVATRREQVVDSYSVQLNLDQIIPERRAELLGRLTGKATKKAEENVEKVAAATEAAAEGKDAN